MKQVIQSLFEKNLLTESQKNTLISIESGEIFSLHYELRFILFVGLSIFSSGIGILVYQNIDSIGHQAIMISILFSTFGIVYFVYKRTPPFKASEKAEINEAFEYLLLLSSVLFGILAGYVQYVYGIFGSYYYLITLLPAIYYFLIAYRFDHKGVLSLAIAALASTIGVSFKPTQFWVNNFDNHTELIVPAILFSLSLMIAAYYFKKTSFKAHFMPIYFYFGIILLLFSTNSGLLCFEYKFLWFLLVIASCGISFLYAKQNKLFLFFLLSIFFGYFGVTYVIYLLSNQFENDFMLFFYYCIFSSIGIIVLIFRHKTILK